jgi:membrane protein required for colicin V production
MITNWLDIVLLIILLVSFILGLIKGFMRQTINIAAVVIGLIIAARYCRPAAGIFSRAFASDKWAHLIAFILIFIAVLVSGALLSKLVSKLVKGPLRFIDRILGGALGIITGVLTCGVLVMALLVFPVDKQALMGSSVAPYCYWLTKGMIQVIPRELKEKFKETYQEIVGSPRQHGEEI